MRAWKELLLPVSVAEIYRPGSGNSPAARWIPLSFFAKNVMIGVTFSYWILTTRVRNKKKGVVLCGRRKDHRFVLGTE